MLLDESDIEAIVEHLAAKVQFYDARGAADNTRARNVIRTALESYAGTSSSKSAERFDLVKIAFERYIGHGQPDRTDKQFGERCVRYADAALAAMDATPDAAPSAGDLLTDMEVSMGPVLIDLQAKIQARLDADAHANADNPTTNVRVGGYRDGGCDAYRHVLKMIVAAMEKTGQTENDDGN